jgi:hypothetical protein
LRLGKKLFIAALAVAFLAVLAYQGYIHFHYRMYNGYARYLPDRERVYAEGRPFAPLAGGGMVEGMELAADNGILQLYADSASGDIAVYNAATGVVTYANPPGVENDDSINTYNKSLLRSVLVVDFFNATRTPGRYISYDMAVRNGNPVVLESIPGGLRVTYTLGDLTVRTRNVPIYIHRDRLEIFLRRIEDIFDSRERSYVEEKYRPADDAPDGFLVLRDNARGPTIIARMNQDLAEAGYTEEDLIADSLASGVEGAISISFDIPVEYTLDGASLVAMVATSRIEERGGARIDKIQLLRNFGAAGLGEEGYFLVPNGSGSLIRFNNGKGRADDYAQFIYDMDPLAELFLTQGNTEPARLPVFGIHKANSDILAVIEEGKSFAQIMATVSGTTPYNAIRANFVVRGSTTYSMFGTTGNENEMPVVEPDIYDADLTVRYTFLSADYSGYSGMARAYRERLQSEGALPAENLPMSDIPLYADIIGATVGTKFALSVPYLGIVPMTTYEQAGEMAARLDSGGVSNLVFNLQGWFNKGYYHDAPDKIKLVRQLGSKKDLEALSSRLESQGGKLYADTALQNLSYIVSRGTRYNYMHQNSRSYVGYVIGIGQLNPMTYYPDSTLGYFETGKEIVSPKFITRYVDAFIKNISKFAVTGVSLRDLGDKLQSDRKRTEMIDREMALSIVTAQLAKFGESDKDIMVAGGNDYAFAHADDLIGVPLSHNAFFIVDDEVPFYQMVIHGLLPYCGHAANRSDAFGGEALVLRLLEYGASPRFTLTAEEASLMKYTGLNLMYGTYAENRIDYAAELYGIVNPVLSLVSGSCVQSHDILGEGVRKVTYDNGVAIYVNYSGKAFVTTEDETIPAGGWHITTGGGRA